MIRIIIKKRRGGRGEQKVAGGEEGEEVIDLGLGISGVIVPSKHDILFIWIFLF